jgi:transcriptional regulator with XRE-family HTH domain
MVYFGSVVYPGEPLSPFVTEPEGSRVVASSPTALKRWIAIEMRRLREAAGLDRPTAADRIGKANTVVAHIETGRNLPAPSDVEVLLNLYGVPERVPFFRDLIRTAKRGKDWWIGFTDAVPEWFELYLGLESAAARISSYDAQWVPGLFQTRVYAEAIYRAGERWRSEEEIAAKVEVRMGRQAVLSRPDDPPHVWCVLDEAVLHRAVGGPAVMRGQLEHLLDLADRPNIDLQVLAADSGAHAGAEGTFTILEYPAEFGGDPGTAYVETRQQGVYYEQPAQVTDYRRVFERLQQQAERVDRSRDLIAEAGRNLE